MNGVNGKSRDVSGDNLTAEQRAEVNAMVNEVCKVTGIYNAEQVSGSGMAIESLETHRIDLGNSEYGVLHVARVRDDRVPEPLRCRDVSPGGMRRIHARASTEAPKVGLYASVVGIRTLSIILNSEGSGDPTDGEIREAVARAIKLLKAEN